MKRFPLILCLFGSVIAFGQKLTYSIQAGINYPLVADVSKSPSLTSVSIPSSSGFTSITTNVGKLTESYQGNVGTFVSGTVSRQISDRFSITTGLSFEYRRYTRDVIVEVTENPIVLLNPTTGQPFGQLQGGFIVRDANGNPVVSPTGYPVINSYQAGDRIGDTETFSVEAPVLVGARLLRQKFLVQLGFNFGYLVSAAEYKSFNAEKVSNARDFNRFTGGLNFSTTYSVTSRIGVRISAIRNFTSIQRSTEDRVGSAYLNSFSFGISYSLTK